MSLLHFLMKPTKIFFFIFLYSLSLQHCKSEEPIVETCNLGENRPDLFIKDLIMSDDNTGFHAVFTNIGGNPIEGEDFLISFSCEFGNYLGNENYRLIVPQRNETIVSNKIDLFVLNITSSQAVSIKTVVDWEERVNEVDECNNKQTFPLNY